MATVRRRFLGRVALAFAASLLALAAAEGLLRAAFHGTVGRLRVGRGTGDALATVRILCVGDSYTFGLYWRPEEAWPARLEQMLNAARQPEGAPRFGVVNAGIPAQNLAQVAAALPDQLAKWRPSAVFVLGGQNDRWNFARPEEQGAVRRFVEGLALVRMFRLLTTAAPADEGAGAGPGRIGSFGREKIEVTTGDGAAAIDIENHQQDRRGDEELTALCTNELELIVQRCRDAGALPILCSYPSPERAYAAPAQAARAVAAAADVPFLDWRSWFARELERMDYAELFIPGDRHPTDRGHYRMALLAARTLARAGLFAPLPAGLVGATDDEAMAKAGELAPGVPELVHPCTIELAPDPGGKCRLLLRGPPGATFHVVVARAAEPPQKLGARLLPLAADDLFAQHQADPALAGTFEPDGTARLELSEALAKEAAFAALIVLHDLQLKAIDLAIRAIVGPVKLRND